MKLKERKGRFDARKEKKSTATDNSNLNMKEDSEQKRELKTKHYVNKKLKPGANASNRSAIE